MARPGRTCRSILIGWVAVLETQAEETAGFAELLSCRRVRDVIDDLLGLPGHVVAPDRRGALLADDVAVLEGRHRPVDPGHHGGHVRLGVPRRQRDDRLAAWRMESTDHEVGSARRIRSGPGR